MRRSTDRILTTHVGALPAPLDVWARPDVAEERLAAAVADVCDLQRRAGIDFINEGELTKGGHWIEYLPARLGGYEASGHPGAYGELLLSSTDWVEFRDFYLAVLANGTLFEQSGAAQQVPEGAEATTQTVEDWVSASPIHYRGQAALEREISIMKGALGDIPASDAFLTSTAPLSVEPGRDKGMYATDEEHVYAIAEAMQVEYEAIAAAGFQVQVDDAWLARAVGSHRHPDGDRRLPQVLPDAVRSPQPRAAQHPGRADPVPPLLGQLARAALGRPSAAGRRRHHADDQGADVLDRGGQRAPRARGGALEDDASCRRARSWRRASSPTRRR